MLARPTFRNAIATAAISLLLFPPTATAHADPLDCANFVGDETRIAIAAARTWVAARWQQRGQLWTSSYRLKPEPSLPLGMQTFMAAKRAGPVTAAEPISGRVEATEMRCTVASIAAADHVYTIKFASQSLRFNEAGHGWTRPQRGGLLHVLELRIAGDGTTPIIAAVPDAPTALPPDAELMRPGTATK